APRTGSATQQSRSVNSSCDSPMDPGLRRDLDLSMIDLTNFTIRTLVQVSDSGRQGEPAGPGSGFVEPEGVEPHHVVKAEIFVRVVAFDVVVPDVVDLLPRDRQ